MVTAESEAYLQQRRLEDPVGQARLEYHFGKEVDLSQYLPGARLDIIDSLYKSRFELYILRPLLCQIRRILTPVVK